MDQQDKQDRTELSQVPEKPPSETSRRTRLFAWLGVIFMVLLVLGYTYSLASGAIFAW